MTQINTTKFKPQTAMRKHRAVAVGNCFVGLCAVLNHQGKQFAIIAGDIETLDYAWFKLTHGELAKDGVQHVCIFSQKETELKE